MRSRSRTTGGSRSGDRNTGAGRRRPAVSIQRVASLTAVVLRATAVVVLRTALRLDAIKSEALASLARSVTTVTISRGCERYGWKRSSRGGGCDGGWLRTALSELRVATGAAVGVSVTLKILAKSSQGALCRGLLTAPSRG